MKKLNKWFGFTLPSLVFSLVAVTSCGQHPEAATTSQSASVVTPTKAADDLGDMIAIKQRIAAKLKETGLPTEVTGLKTLPVKGWYLATLKNQPSLIVSSDGEYVMQGDLLHLQKGGVKNVTQEMVASEAKELLSKVPQKDMIIFAPVGKPKAVVYAFTDVDCGYCRKLHSQIKQYNDKGIEVRYLAWPRAPQFVPPIEAVWCSEDRKAALTNAKMGLPVNAPKCKSPVMEEHALGAQLGVTGTPAVFTESGEQIGGYLPPDDMAKALKIN